MPSSIPFDKYSRSIYTVSKILSVIVIPIAFYGIIQQYITSQVYGYIGIYYGDEVQAQGSFLTIGQLFFVCLLGLLIGSRYKKSIVVIVYILFFIYVLIGLACGDRSGWFYILLILIWMHHTFYKPFKERQIIRGTIIAIAALYLIQAIVEVRNVGINYESVSESFSLDNYPIVAFINEMGGSLSIIIVAINKNVVYPYGNSIFLGLLAMVTMKIPALLGIDYMPITDWFSWEYLGLNYGAGFSIYAEMAVNFGVLIAPFLFFLVAFIARKFLDVSERINTLSSLSLLFMIGTSSFFISSIRNTFHDFFKYWFLGCFAFILIIYIYHKFFGTKNSKRIINRYE